MLPSGVLKSGMMILAVCAVRNFCACPNYSAPKSDRSLGLTRARTCSRSSPRVKRKRFVTDRHSAALASFFACVKGGTLDRVRQILRMREALQAFWPQIPCNRDENIRHESHVVRSRYFLI